MGEVVSQQSATSGPCVVRSTTAATRLPDRSIPVVDVPPWQRWAEPVTGLLLILWALYQNFWNLSDSNLHPDETIYAEAGWSYVHGDFQLNLEHPFTAKYIIGVAQVILGEGVESGRVAAAFASVITGLVLWWWLRGEAGRTTAMLAGAMWLLLPRVASSIWGPRIDRYALLEPFMIMFAVVAAYACWRWTRTGNWLPAVVSACAIALAATCKVPAAVIAPVLIVTPLLARREWRTVRQAGMFVLIAATVVVMTYLPSGDVVSPISYMLEFQGRHAAAGHLVEVAGISTFYPPWWTNIYWMAQGIGWLASLGLLIGVTLWLIYRQSALGAFVALILAAFAFFLLVISSVALTHYYLAMLPWLCVLSAIGLTAPWRVERAWPAGIMGALRVGALTAGLLLVCSAVGTTVANARLHPWGPARVEEALINTGHPSGPVLMTGFHEWEYFPYVHQPVTEYRSDIIAIAVHRGWLRSMPNASTLRLVDEHPEDFDRIQLDEVELYIVRVPRAPK